jgi:hypothetical protein
MPDDQSHKHKHQTLGQLHYKEEWSPFGEADANDPDPAVRRRFFGKYRGTVRENEDPLLQGRLLVSVPDVLGLFSSSWALPCMPMAGPLMGVFTRPIIGATVWVEFEQGDPDRPIWVGGFWAPGEMSVIADAATAATPPLFPTITITTATGGLSISDSPVTMPVGVAPPGMVTLEYGNGAAQIVLSPTGIYLTAPTVTIMAQSTFAVTAPNITLNGATTITGVTKVTGATTITGVTTVT